MKNTTYTNADQATCSRVLPILKGFSGQLPALRIHGRYALALELTEAARPVLEAALAYCSELAAEIGEDTFLGSCGTVAEWTNEFNSQLSRIAA
tara:strand:- start:61930 stop:62211 length:282 start_codon:yes stop_codon:yes gene_type:complete